MNYVGAGKLACNRDDEIMDGGLYQSKFSEGNHYILYKVRVGMGGGGNPRLKVFKSRHFFKSKCMSSGG